MKKRIITNNLNYLGLKKGDIISLNKEKNEWKKTESFKNTIPIPNVIIEKISDWLEDVKLEFTSSEGYFNDFFVKDFAIHCNKFNKDYLEENIEKELNLFINEQFKEDNQEKE